MKVLSFVRDVRTFEMTPKSTHALSNFFLLKERKTTLFTIRKDAKGHGLYKKSQRENIHKLTQQRNQRNTAVLGHEYLVGEGV